MKKLFAEFLGTFALVFAGTGAIVINAASGGAIGHAGIALTFGLIVLAMIYTFGDVSGAHLNPAVTIAFAGARRFPWNAVAGKSKLLKRIDAAPQVQFCYELAGAHDLLLLFDCADMAEFNAVAEAVLVADATVRRYETSFVKREVKFAPFVALSARDAAA